MLQLNTDGALAEPLPVTAIILTRNEARNIRAALESIRAHVSQIVVIDSHSTDGTVSIAAEYGCRVVQFPPATQASIFDWVLRNVEVTTPWTIRVDADERWSPEGFAELRNLIVSDAHDGVYVNRKTYFMGRWIRYGGYYPIRLILAWRTGKAQIENRLMDEHFIVEGSVFQSSIDVIEANYDRQQNLSLWTDKHNRYSDRYAAERILKEFNLLKFNSVGGGDSSATSVKIWAKDNLYERSPLFWRAFIYFAYRYFFQLGFLDGKRGFVYHLLQAFWFRFLVDAKIYQLRKNLKNQPEIAIHYLTDHYGITVRDGAVFFEK